jgi:PKD repeat protein
VNRWKWRATAASAVALTVSLLAGPMGLIATTAQANARAATGVGSCTIKNWKPGADPDDAADLPEGDRPQSYKPDDFDCTGASFAKEGVEFTKFPQPHNFHITNKKAIRSVPQCRTGVCPASTTVMQPTATANPLAPYFPPFKHVVVILRENHTFDDYLGDCATTVAAGCNGAVQSTNHISSVPNLHTLAKTYGLSDAYSTGTQPPSGPNHWWLFSGQSASSSQQQSYPSATGTQFDRMLNGTGGKTFPFVTNGDIYWMVNSGSGYWRNPATGNVEWLPVNRPGTNVPEELHYNEYTTKGQNVSDQTIANDYLSYVGTNGLPAYSYVELFNDHPGTYQDIPTNDATTKQVVDSIMGNAAYKDNTLIVVTEDDTQNGSNGPDHVSNTYRVPLVVIGSPTYVKQHYLSHVAYSTNNVLAAMERVMENNTPGIIDPTNAIGLQSFPMTTTDQAALGDPLEDFWVQGSTPLTATASASPTSGNSPLGVNFTGSATGGASPYSYSWNFGDGSATSTAQNPSHTYNTAGTYTATLTVTDNSSPAKTAQSTVTVTVSAVGSPLTASASATPTSGQIPLNVAFSGSGTGGTPPYSYSWNFGDGSATSTAQNPSHTYNTAGTYTATLTVTDSSSPARTAQSTVTVTSSPVGGTAPDAPTGLTAKAGSGQASLSWTAPAKDGGVSVENYRVYRGTSPGAETLLTSGGCSGLGTVLSCTDTGLTNGQTYYYKVSAVNAIGEGAQSNEATVTPGSTCVATQLLGNPGFETGTAAPWTASSGVVSNNTGESPHSGTWYAWMDGYGTTRTDTLSQSVTLPTGCTTYNAGFWLHIDTAETSTTTKYDTLTVQVLNSSGTVLSTPATYSNLDHNTGYAQRGINLAPYAGQTITLRFTGAEDYTKQTSFVVDDTALNVS